MIAASYVGQKPKWPQFNWVPWFYLAAGICAAVVLFSGLQRRVAISRLQLILVILDVLAIFTFKIAAVDGAYTPLLMLTLLPIMVVLDVSWRRAAVALVVIAGTFAVEVFTDHVMLAQAGFGRAVMVTVVFGFLCCTAFLAVWAQSRQLDDITALSAVHTQARAWWQQEREVIVGPPLRVAARPEGADLTVVHRLGVVRGDNLRRRKRRRFR